MNTPSGALAQAIEVSAAAMASLEGETVPIATDTLMNIAFPYANIKAYWIMATCDCSIDTNATDASGGQTISLTANVPKVYMTAAGMTNVFSANVTKIYVTAAAAGELTMRVLYDPTP